MTEILNTNNYTPLSNDPTEASRKNLRSILLTYATETKEPEIIRLAKHLRFASNYRPPELYGLPKVHKPGVPFRPIVSTINSITSELSRYLKKIIKPLTSKEQSFVKNSKTFVNEIRNYNLETDEILVSYDVKELFPSIPISDALDTLYNLLNADTNLLSITKLNPFHIIKLVSFCMQEGNYFLFDNKFYKQSNGVPMGSPLSPVMAEIFMESFERQMFEKVDRQIAPRLFRRYVDDISVIIKDGKEEQFLHFLNSIRPNQIAFTMEKEENKTLPFLDALIIHTNQGLKTRVYRKPTHTLTSTSISHRITHVR
ncbi:hypothetical protein M513_14091 [Trichuris suis]|uniref:Reverse transcriptase domain-containing protein n=1 Tax=Trichuris suis TaxID=68888 RepID=A0A085LJ86_9BILA|nr:hypothetical protein M513_14091 [Trichuris suis]